MYLLVSYVCSVEKDSVIHKLPADDLLLNILYIVGNNVPFAQLA